MIQDLVAALAREAGFSKAGIAPVPPPGDPSDYPELAYFENWIEDGRAGEMEYLKRRDQDSRLLRSSLRIAIPWARSVIVCAANYNASAPKSTDPAPPDAAWIARYAWTGYGHPEAKPSDYHDVLLARLKTLEHSLHHQLGPFESRCSVDTGPLARAALPPGTQASAGLAKTPAHPRPGARIVALSRRDHHRARAAARAHQAAGRPLWQLHPLPRRLPHGRSDSALPNGCRPLHRLPDD